MLCMYKQSNSGFHHLTPRFLEWCLHLWVEETRIGLHDAHSLVEGLYIVERALVVAQHGSEI